MMVFARASRRLALPVAGGLVALVLLLSAQVRADTTDPLLDAIELPRQADRLRTAGVPPADVAVVLGEARGKGLSGRDAKDVLQAGADATDEFGPIDNFGAFVKGRLADGLRGQDLAAAIKAEHLARGSKRPVDPPDRGKGKAPGDKEPGKAPGKAPDDGGKGKAPDGGKGKSPDGGGKSPGKAPDGGGKAKSPGKAPEVPSGAKPKGGAR